MKESKNHKAETRGSHNNYKQIQVSAPLIYRSRGLTLKKKVGGVER